MKQSSTSGERTTSLLNWFDENEIEVADILLDLPNLITKTISRDQPTVPWGKKRKRSVRAFLPRSSESKLPQNNVPVKSEIEVRRPNVQDESTSPTTPLSFTSSESDEKSNQSLRKSSKKRTREEWLEIIEGLTQQRELLRGEVETVRNYRNNLKALNLELKTKKQEVISCLEKERPNLEMNKSSNLGPEQHQSAIINHQQPLIMDQRASGSQTSQNFQYPHCQIAPPLVTSNSDGPRGIPDLNISVEETLMIDYSQPLDLNRVLAENKAKVAAEARRSRMIKNKIKGMNSSSGGARPPRFR